MSKPDFKLTREARETVESDATVHKGTDNHRMLYFHANFASLGDILRFLRKQGISPDNAYIDPHDCNTDEVCVDYYE